MKFGVMLMLWVDLTFSLVHSKTYLCNYHFSKFLLKTFEQLTISLFSYRTFLFFFFEQFLSHVELLITVWLYATLSIMVVSLCGLLGVAVIPVMQRVFYQQLLQFLVALAVGTLCGDALLHLLPHVSKLLLHLEVVIVKVHWYEVIQNTDIDIIFTILVMDLVTFLIRKYYTCNGSLIEICLMVIM
jgi:hypothetical protein